MVSVITSSGKSDTGTVATVIYQDGDKVLIAKEFYPSNGEPYVGAVDEYPLDLISIPYIKNSLQ